MSHELTSEDGLVLTARPAWHGLGTVVEQAPTVQGALQLAGLDWTVRRRRLLVGSDEGAVAEGTRLNVVPDRVALQRSDTGRILEVVGKGYEVLQNADLADLIDGLSREGEVARAESAGSLRQGRRVFFLIRRGGFTLGASDEVANYLLFSNTHDGTGALGIIPTTIRVVCANTLRAAEAGFSIRHSQSMRERIEGAKLALREADGGVARMRASIERLASVTVDMDDVRTFFLRVYETAFGIIPAKPANEAEERARARAVATVSEWVANLDSARNRGTGTEGTVWHALNAATEWSDHKRGVRPGAEDSEHRARAQSNLFGTSATFKAVALRQALALAQ